MVIGWKIWQQATKKLMLSSRIVCFWYISTLHWITHFQACISRSAIDPLPPNMDPLKYVWSKGCTSRVLIPTTNLDVKPPAPTYVLQLTCCSCSSELPCAVSRCGCFLAHLSCTIFYSCKQAKDYQNQWTKYTGEPLSNNKGDKCWEYHIFIIFCYLNLTLCNIKREMLVDKF